jgi:hypothetical protein
MFFSLDFVCVFVFVYAVSSSPFRRGKEKGERGREGEKMKGGKKGKKERHQNSHRLRPRSDNDDDE